MAERSPKQVTQLLLEWSHGDQQALNQLMPIIYGELRQLADRYLHSERPDHTLQPTALVHEAYLRLVDVDVQWESRTHFFAVAARLMRHVLVDYAKHRRAAKRGGAGYKVSLQGAAVTPPEQDVDLLALDGALDRLAVIDPRQSQIIDLHFFGGLTYEETAQVLSISPVTVHRELKMAKAWLYKAVRGDDA